MINDVRNAVLVAITFVVCHTTDGQYFLGCPPVDDTDDTVTLLPNPFDCSTFYICAQGTPLLLSCPGNLQFNYELKVCDYPERANCFELQQYPEPATTDVPVSQPEVEDVQQERKPGHVENAVPQPTEGEVRVEPHPEHPRDTEEPQSHSGDLSSEPTDLPVQTRSYEKAEEELIAPTEPVETPQPQPPQEEAVPERQPEHIQGPDESGIVLEPSAQTDSAAALQPQPTENPTEEELHDAVATAASAVEPNSARSRGLTYPDHETTPQASEEAEPESDQGGGSSYEENLGSAVEPGESQQNPESQTTEMPGQSERQDTAVQAEPIPDKKSVSSENTNEGEADSGSAIEPTLPALELQPQPSTQEPKEEPETEFHGDATQAPSQGEPTTQASSPVSDSEQLEEEPAEAADIKAQTALEEAQPADEEQAPSQSIPPATLQPEQLPADAQVVEETARPSADFEPHSTDGRVEVQEPTYKPSQLKPAHSDVQSEAVDDTTESTTGQTVARAQEPSEPAPEPSAVEQEFESVVTQEPTGILRGEPSDVVEEQQPSRGITQSDQTAEPASDIESVASEPLEPAYASTEEPSQPEDTEGEVNLPPETKQAVPEPEQEVTKPPATLGLEHNETQPKLAPARQPTVGPSEAEYTENDVDANIEDQLSEEQVQSSTEFDHSEQQPTPQPIEVQAENTAVAEDPHSSPDAEVLQSEETEGTADHSPLVNDALPEASSLPPARPHDTFETNDETITMQTEKSIDTEPAASVLDSKADSEAAKQPASQLGLENSNPVPVEEEVDVTKTEPESVPIQQQDASTSVPNDPDHDNILQTSGEAARAPETDSLALAPVDERVSDVAEQKQAPESSGASLIGDREANVDSAPEEAETSAVLDDVDAQYNEPRNNAVEIDYYT